jgi:two-component system OmpR family sensor kinase
VRRGPTRSRRSLRTRLLVALVVPLVAVLAVVGVVSVTALRHQLVGQVDARLDAATDRSRDYTAGPGPGHGRPGDGGPGPAFLGARGQGEGTLGATITDGAVTSAGVLGARGQEIELSAAQQAVLVGLPPGGGPATLDLGGDLGSYRVVADPAPGGDVLVTGLPLAGTADAVRNLVLVELLAGLLALLAAAGCGAGRPPHPAAAGPGRGHRHPGVGAAAGQR